MTRIEDVLGIIGILSEEHVKGKEIMRRLQLTRNKFDKLKVYLRNNGINILYDPSSQTYSINNNAILSNAEARALSRLNRWFLNDKEFDELYKHMNRYRVYPEIELTFSDNIIRFLVISDIHACSKKYRPDIMRHAAATAKRINAAFVINAGDSTEGINRDRPEQIFDLDPFHGLGDTSQAEYIARELDQFEGIKVYSVEPRGSHSGWSGKYSNLDIADLIRMKSNELGHGQYVPIGYNSGDIVINGIRIRVRHPDRGTLKGYVESLMPNDKPHILVHGHFHGQVMYKPYRNVHCIDAGCMQSATTFLERKGSQPVLGYWVCEMEVGDTPSKTGQTLLRNGKYLESFGAYFKQFYDEGNFIEVDLNEPQETED